MCSEFGRRVKVSDAAVGSAQRHRAVQEEIRVHHSVWLDLRRKFDFWFSFSRSVMWSDFLHLRVSESRSRLVSDSKQQQKHSFTLYVFIYIYR